MSLKILQTKPGTPTQSNDQIVDLPLKNFVKIKASPPPPPPKEIFNFYNLPLENSMVPQLGGADNAIAHCLFEFGNSTPLNSYRKKWPVRCK